MGGRAGSHVASETRSLRFLTCHLISVCELPFGGSYFLWAPWLWRHASGKVRVSLLGSIDFKPICTLISPFVLSTLWDNDTNLDPASVLGTVWILIFCR